MQHFTKPTNCEVLMFSSFSLFFPYKQYSKRRLYLSEMHVAFLLYLDERDEVKLKFHISILLVKWKCSLVQRIFCGFFSKQACTTVCVVMAHFGDLFTSVPFISKFFATDKAFKYFLSEKEHENCLKLEPSSHSLEYRFSLWEDCLVQSNWKLKLGLFEQSKLKEETAKQILFNSCAFFIFTLAVASSSDKTFWY